MARAERNPCVRPDREARDACEDFHEPMSGVARGIP